MQRLHLPLSLEGVFLACALRGLVSNGMGDIILIVAVPITPNVSLGLAPCGHWELIISDEKATPHHQLN